jgi:hypothetical protein
MVDVMKLPQLVCKLDSFHFQVDGYQIDVGIWLMILQTNKYYYWCRYTCFGYEIMRGYKLPLLLCWNNFIKLLNTFIFATIVSECSLPIVGLRFVVSFGDYLGEWLGPLAQLILLHFLCRSLVCTLYVISMFGAFTNSFSISCTCCLFYICACSNTCWCITRSNYFLGLFVTNFHIFWNQ